ncbi:MAG: zinc ribbon domain-containing protein [Pyrinomonadaceae bacterium]
MNNAWKIIEDHIARKGGGYVPPLPVRCGNCGSANTAGAGFCSSCGADIRSGACPACGAIKRMLPDSVTVAASPWQRPVAVKLFLEHKLLVRRAS